MSIVSQKFLVCAIVFGLIMPFSVFAQKGADEPTGIAERNVLPEVFSLKGTVMKVITGPCEKTTGKSPSGTHVMLRNDKGTYNVHLGPESAVDHAVSQLKDGQEVTFSVFRTEALPADAVIAKSVTIDGKVIHFRDRNLRPSWALQPGKKSGKRRQSASPCT